MLRAVTTACVLLLLAVSDALAGSGPRNDFRIALVEGRALSYRVLGSGQPVLVMISGLGDGMRSFDGVAPRLATQGTVIVYDRAGYGGSALGKGLRDAAAADRELSALLVQSGVRGPYFVLGHSLGGLFAEYFAAQHAGEVQGLILEESRPADFATRCQSAALRGCTPPAALMAMTPKGAQAEWAALSTTTREVGRVSPSTRPTLIMSRPLPHAPSAWEAFWAAEQANLAARFENGMQVIAPSGGHYLHRDAADWFVASVSAFMQRHVNTQAAPGQAL